MQPDPDSGLNGNTDRRVPKSLYTLARLVTVGFILVSGLGLIWAWPLSGSRHLGANLLGTYLLIWALAFAFGKAPKAETTLRFALTTVSLGLVLFLLEGLSLAGIVDYSQMLRGESREEPWLNPGNDYDPELLYVRRPNTRYAQPRRGNIADALCLPSSANEPTIEVLYDRNGFRNESYPDSTDIAVVGDSYIEAASTVNYEETLTSELARLSGRAVTNLGRAGYGPQQQLVVLERYALPLRPNVVVWAFYEGNDLNDLVRYEQTLEQLRSGPRRRPSLTERSFSNNLLDRVYEALASCQPTPWAEERYAVFRTAEGQRVRYYFTEGSRELTAQDLDGLEKVGEILGEAYEWTAREGADFVVVLVPLKFRAFADAIEIPRESELWSVVLNDFPSRLRQVVEEAAPNAGFLDLTPAFAAAADRGVPVYLSDDTHWSADGNRIAAEAILEYLNGRGDGQ